jgi:hypothetical protein
MEQAPAIILLAFLVVGVVTSYGVGIGDGFVPSPLIDRIAPWTLAVAAVLGTLIALLAPADLHCAPVWLQFWVSRMAVSAGTCAILLWSAFFGPAWAYSALLGLSTERAVTVDHWRQTVKICGSPDVREASFTAPICLDNSWLTKLPPGATFYVSGPSTALGMDVRHITLLPTTNKSSRGPYRPRLTTDQT